MLDLDEFKNVNDTYGHKIGDKMLREVAHIVEGQLREYDFLARYGGDEFVALVQEVVGAQVEELCLRIESAVSRFSLPVGRNRFARVGISVGTATFGVDGESGRPGRGMVERNAAVHFSALEFRREHFAQRGIERAQFVRQAQLDVEIAMVD